MSPAPASAFEAGIHAVVVGGLALCLGRLVAGGLVRALRVRVDAVTLWGLAFPGLAVLALALTLAHVASRGAVFSSGAVTRGAVVACAAACSLAVLRGPRPGASAAERVLVAGAAVAALALWCYPVFTRLPVDFGGDTTFHTMWAAELLNGTPTPVPVITGPAPNGYPYLWHGFLAALARFTPGGTSLHALGPAQVAVACGAALTAASLGRVLWGSSAAGAGAAIFGALSGGFGWLVTRGPALVEHPRARRLVEHYLGDFLANRSYNLAFHNLVPPYPRDFTYALLPAFFLLVVLGRDRRSTRLLVAAGTVAGMLGLAGGEAFFVALGVAVVVALASPGRRLLTGACLLVPAVGLYSLWAVPVLVSYVRFGGFNDLSAAPVTLSARAILGSWGPATAFALGGAVVLVAHHRGRPGLPVVAGALGVPATILLASSLGADALPPGLQTLGRPHRYWPLLYLGVALVGAVGFGLLLGRRSRAGRVAAGAVALVVAACSFASPLLASLAYARGGGEVPPLLTGALRGRPHALLRVLAPVPGGGSCTVAVPGEIAHAVTAYTGYRVVFLPFYRRPRGQARLRYPAVPGIVPHDQRAEDNSLLTKGLPGSEDLARLARKYDLDAVVRPVELGSAPGLQGLPSELSAEGYRVWWLERSCRGAGG